MIEEIRVFLPPNSPAAACAVLLKGSTSYFAVLRIKSLQEDDEPELQVMRQLLDGAQGVDIQAYRLTAGQLSPQSEFGMDDLRDFSLLRGARIKNESRQTITRFLRLAGLSCLEQVIDHPLLLN